MYKSTELLINELKNTDQIDDFVTENFNEIEELSLSSYLQELLGKYQVDVCDVLKRGGMEAKNYIYEIFRSDKKKPSRDILIRICIGFPLNIEEARKVLRCGKVRPLYPRDERDAYIMFALNKKYDINALNDLLYDQNLDLFE